MNKILVFAVLLVLIAVGAFYYASWNKSTPAPKETVISVPQVVDTVGHFQSLRISTFVNSTTGVKISFGALKTDARNGIADVLIDGKRIGEVNAGDVGSDQFSFSPDNRYFAFRSEFSLGGSDFYQAVNIIDLSTKAITSIEAPELHVATSTVQLDPGASVDRFIESYSWNAGGLEVISYLISDGHNVQPGKEVFYRITPKEVWQYDINTNAYSFVQTLPEDASTE